MNPSAPLDAAMAQFLADLDKPAPEPVLLSVPDATRGFLLLLTLDGTKPEVWRSLCVPGDITLPQLHVVIQAAMGWADYHLHRFSVQVGGEVRPFLTDFDISEGDVGLTERDVRLDQILQHPGDALHHDYDFGDGWQHTLIVDEVLSTPPPAPVLIDGQLACPPEDCGGVHGYEALVRWVVHNYSHDYLPPQFENDLHAHSWLPRCWKPDEFDVEAARARIATNYQIATATLISVRPELAERLETLADTFPGQNSFGTTELQVVLSAPGAHGPTELSDEDAARLLAPFMAVADVIGDGVDLTKAGYLRPPLPRLIAESAGITNFWIRPIASEYQAWPALQLRQTTQALGLVTSRKGRISATKVATVNRDKPAKVVRHVVGRLPLGKAAAERDAGWATLAVIANDVPVENWDTQISELLFTMGWADETGAHEPDAGNATLDVFTIMARSLSGEGTPKGIYPALGALARQALHD